MTEDVKATRLSKAAREFNVGISTIVEFLHKKGFVLDPNPNTKLPHEAYLLLVKEYSTDISAKKESEKLILKDLHRKKESVSIDDFSEKSPSEDIERDEEVLVKDSSVIKKGVDIKTEISKPDIKLVGKIDLDKATRPKTEKPASQKEVQEEKPAPKPVGPEKEKTTPKKEEKKVPIDLHIVGKIDLGTIAKEGKPAAEEELTKHPIEKAVEQKEEIVEKGQKKREPIEEPVAPLTDEEVLTDEIIAGPSIEPEEEIIELFRPDFKKLSGPTVIGKIDLPVEEKKKQASNQPVKIDPDSDFRRKKRRKRITKDKDQISVVKPDLTKEREKGGKRVLKKRPVRTEVDEEEVQKQIKETLARLTTKGKSKGSRYRREKRDAISQKHKEAEDQLEQSRNILKVTEFVSANELAIMMNVPVTEIISTCMNLGLFVSINQRLDAETMAVLADEFGYKVEFVSAELQEAVKEEDDEEEKLQPRPPIVTVMGHVDHGKTKLLDYIRRTNVIAGEAGGITQHIGAYGVRLDDGRQITFLDTPGHEAFTAMRARGAQITDIAIIVVAADDGVMPQTVEAINHASAAGVPIVFAINKIDKPTANPDKIKEALANMNYLVEDWGGKYQSQEISAKTGLNIDLLLDKVLLEAEMLDLKANPEKPAIGTVIESSLDKGRGYTATILVKAGTLRVGDIMLAGSCYGHIKAMYNERGHKITEALPAAPALVLGLNGAPQAGDKFNVMESDREAKDIANKRAQLQREQGLRTQKHITLDEIGRRIAIGNFQELNIIVKGDVDGSIEALSDSLIKLSTPEIQLNVIHKAVGQISESDILLAAASNAIIVGFQVRPSLNARKLAEKEEIDIRLYSIIYDAIEEIKSAMEGMLSPEVKEEIVATLEIREIFKVTKVGTVAGCYVKEGKITRNSKVRVIRDGIVIYTGELGSLKRFKDDVKEVVGGYECGLNIQNFNDIKIADIIEAYQEVEVKKTL
ncbi:MAG TPA: translation initiation factor IF-2 [Bacteroidales bacterium]|jgi:translation initiation factor IF-2|nr:translation initiation factor IF-2 [Bacteroidales bacterium]OQB62290.1 MAG: Translation initiation factor IF-2 [Bacteroidetes bacterium ADurb.Bin145]NMD01930.1 translation initiation factor IF-2 [Bacteroidales bacterium]HOU02832.1 translation initiation factor IF-2 [Bacteroidales bacterium]HQG63839.1 translation initiation factor IF-2 [Bacteroidales bacterium]